MDLVHRYLYSITKPEDRKRIDNVLLGRKMDTVIRIDERGIPIPDWWQDDEDTEGAAMSNMLTMRNWRKKR
jgi:hypothetical protein